MLWGDQVQGAALIVASGGVDKGVRVFDLNAKPTKSDGLGCGSPLSSSHIHLPSNAGGMRAVVSRRGSAPS